MEAVLEGARQSSRGMASPEADAGIRSIR
jgi:hypothetical protein